MSRIGAGNGPWLVAVMVKWMGWPVTRLVRGSAVMETEISAGTTHVPADAEAEANTSSAASKIDARISLKLESVGKYAVAP